MYPHDKRAPTNIRHPVPVGICDRCGFKYPLSQLVWQFDYRGLNLSNLRLRVCPRDLDIPNPQLKPIVIGPDPIPPRDPRPYHYAQQNAAPTPPIPVVTFDQQFTLDDSPLDGDSGLG